MHNIKKMYLMFCKVFFKQQVAYKFNFWVSILVNINSYLITYLGVWIIFQNIDTIKGWTYDEVIFSYTLNLLTYGIACLIFLKPMEKLEELVKSGEFDMILIRPINSFFFLILKEMDFKYIGHILLSITVLIQNSKILNINWNFEKKIFFLLILFGGILIQSSFIIIAGALSIKYILSSSLIDLLTFSIRKFINYPLDVFDRWIIVILTFFIPYGFVNYYPVRYLLGKDVLLFGKIIGQYATIFVGCICISIASFIYKKMVAQYNSTGN